MSGAAGWEGLPLHVDALGRGPPVVLLHGYGANSFSFRHWVPALARDHRVLAVDLKGFGAAPKPDDGRYSPVDLADLVVRLVRAMDLRETVLVGHSLGGGVSLLVALRLLDAGELARIRGLVSVAGIAYGQRLPPFARLARWPRLARAILTVVPADPLVRYVLRRVVHDPGVVDRPQVAAYAEPLRSDAAHRSFLAVARQIVPPELEALSGRYPEIDIPALLIWGRQDPVVPLEVGRRLHRALPRSRLRILEACGHLVPEERPRESLELVQAFLRTGLPETDDDDIGRSGSRSLGPGQPMSAPDADGR